MTVIMSQNTTTIPIIPENHPLSPEWATVTQILYNCLDLIGIGLKIACIAVIKRRCDVNHAVYNLMIQYLIFGIVLSMAWIIGGWFISAPLVDNQSFLDWLFIQQMVEILPYDLYQVCWAAIGKIYLKNFSGSFIKN